MNVPSPSEQLPGNIPASLRRSQVRLLDADLQRALDGLVEAAGDDGDGGGTAAGALALRLHDAERALKSVRGDLERRTRDRDALLRRLEDGGALAADAALAEAAAKQSEAVALAEASKNELANELETHRRASRVTAETHKAALDSQNAAFQRLVKEKEDAARDLRLASDEAADYKSMSEFLEARSEDFETKLAALQKKLDEATAKKKDEDIAEEDEAFFRYVRKTKASAPAASSDEQDRRVRYRGPSGVFDVA